VVLDRKWGKMIIGRIPEARACVWQSESVLHFFRFSDGGAEEHVWDVAWPEPKMLRRLEGSCDEAYFRYLCSHFADQIGELAKALDDPVVAAALPLAGPLDTSPKPDRWYLRTENVPQAPPLVTETTGGPSACVSPGRKWLAIRGAWSQSGPCAIQIIPLGDSRERSRKQTISPTSGRSMHSRMNWLPDDRHLLFVEMHERYTESGHHPLYTFFVWVYDTKTGRKRFLAEGQRPTFVPHPGRQP